MNLLANRIITPDGTMLQSFHQHDYVTYTDGNGLEYMVDGGLVYQRVIVHEDAPHTDASVYDTDPHDRIREAFCWGTYGKNQDKPRTWVKLKDMSDAHIEAILNTQNHIPTYIYDVFDNEMVYRELLNIHIEDTE